MNFDHVAPTVFWPMFLFLVLLVSAIAGLAISALIRWVDSSPTRYESLDRVAERKRKIAAAGFKSRIGLR